MSIRSVDRTAPRHYGDDRGRYFSVSQVCEALVGGHRWSDQAAMDRGTALHRLFALSVAAYAGLCQPPTIPNAYHGYAASWGKWIDLAKPMPVAIEQRRVSTRKGLPFAGTFDLLCRISDRGKQVLALVDLKSGGKEKWHRMQVQGYGKLVPEADRLALLYLDQNGGLPTWEIVKPDARDWAGFCNALSVLTYRETL